MVRLERLVAFRKVVVLCTLCSVLLNTAQPYNLKTSQPNNLIQPDSTEA